MANDVAGVVVATVEVGKSVVVMTGILVVERLEIDFPGECNKRIGADFVVLKSWFAVAFKCDCDASAVDSCRSVVTSGPVFTVVDRLEAGSLLDDSKSCCRDALEMRVLFGENVAWDVVGATTDIGRAGVVISGMVVVVDRLGSTSPLNDSELVWVEFLVSLP